MDFILADVNQKLIVDALSTLLGTAEIKLITAGTPTKDSLYADFTFAASTGLAAPKAITPGATYKLSDGSWAFLIDDQVFQCTGGLVVETITGYIIQDAATHAIYWGGGLLDTPVSITAVGQGLSVDMLSKGLQLAGSQFPLTFVPDQDA